MKYYAKTQEHAKNIEAFKMFKKRFEWANFYQPNAEKAPWHWQCRISGQGPYDAIINFWPHFAKTQRDGEKVKVGWDYAREIMAEAIEENGFGPAGGEVLE